MIGTRAVSPGPSQLLSEKGEPCILVLENLSQVLDFIWVSFSSLVKLEVELYDLKDLFQLEYSMIMSRVEVWLCLFKQLYAILKQIYIYACI